MEKQIKHTIRTILEPLQEFVRMESAGGLVLIIAAALALIIANSPLMEHYEALLAMPLQVSIGGAGIAKPLILWINDGLMAVFFFLVGLELKREMLDGHLSSLRAASLPAFAAVGGILAPAGIYALFNHGDAGAMNGWAIPTATDIAFALGVLSLLGSRVPAALKALLLSVAIFDDLSAIVLIAVLYTSQLSVTSLIVAGALIFLLFLLNRLGVRRPAAYILVGIPLWVAVLKSGVHATLAGVVLAMFIPLKEAKGKHSRSDAATEHDDSPLRHLEHELHPWVAFGVLPIFAFANAGVPLTGLSMADFIDPVPLGILCGLFFGKQLGIMGLSWLATRFGVAALPDGLHWRHVYGVSILCGIGFTMSLFIASLAFESSGSVQGLERLGILLGTLVSGVVGYWFLRRHLKGAAS